MTRKFTDGSSELRYSTVSPDGRIIQDNFIDCYIVLEEDLFNVICSTKYLVVAVASLKAFKDAFEGGNNEQNTKK